jgi:hypothetical protein
MPSTGNSPEPGSARYETTEPPRPVKRERRTGLGSIVVHFGYMRLCETLRSPDITGNHRKPTSLCATLVAMSSGEAGGDAQGQQRVTHIILRADGWFDGPDRVLPVAAYELDGRAAADSVVYGHAGFVPDYYLADLGPEAAVSAADLVAAGLWGRAEGGYRWLDQEVVDFLRERQRESDEEAARARAREKAKRDEGLAELAEAMLAAPPFAVCGTPSARVELVAPGGFPAEWERLPGTVRDTLPAPRARTVVPAVYRGRGLQRLRRPHRGQQGRPDRPGVPASAVLRAGPHGRVLRRCGYSARTAMPPTATSTGTCRRAGTALVPAATARAWTPTGRRGEQWPGMPG